MIELHTMPGEVFGALARHVLEADHGIRADRALHWTSEPAEAVAYLNALAATYAAKHLWQAKAEEPTALLSSVYRVGESCVEHSDQYKDREGIPDTMDRTVSVSVIVQPAEKGGELVVQDPRRKEPARVLNPEPGRVVIFPADWLHEVREIEAGERRSVVCWWRDRSRDPFVSWKR